MKFFRYILTISIVFSFYFAANTAENKMAIHLDIQEISTEKLGKKTGLDTGSRDCVNDDSTSDAYGDTCSSWYDDYEYEGSGGCTGGYDDDDFSASEQCCVCGGGSTSGDGGEDPDPGCGDGYWDCGDGQCIPASYVCDGSSEFCNASWGPDCANGADEGLDVCGYDDACVSSPECDDCDFDFVNYGSECCDTAWDEYGIDCSTLEANYYWDCTGCGCPGDQVAVDYNFAGYISWNGNIGLGSGPSFDCGYDSSAQTYPGVSSPEEACNAAFGFDGASSGDWQATECENFGQWTSYQCEINGFTTNQFYLGNVTETSIDVLYWSAYDIGGFQFSVDGVGVASASGGAVDELGFDLSIGTGYLLGVSLTNDAIPAGSGLLTTLSIDWYTTPGEVCLNNLTVSDATGVSALDFDASGCQDRFCEDADFDVVCDHADSCVSTLADNLTDGYDCDGVCNGDADILIYWFDADGDGLGAGEPDLFCSAVVEDGWVLNDDDQDDACTSNWHDCAGVCDGTAEVWTYWFDSDADGLGAGNSSDFCNALVEDGWVLNGDDSLPDCTSNITDCNDVCDGPGEDLDYWFDADGDGLGAGDSSVFCSSTVEDGWVLNGDDEDDNCTSNYHDCYGDCDGTAFVDDCGVCSEGNTGHTADSDKDCWGDCFGEAVLDTCDVCSGGNSGHEADSDIDCWGDCFGTALLDECDVCSGGNSGHEANSDKDCWGDCFGAAFLDTCDVCSGGNSGHEAESDRDCNDDCFGTAFLDTCDVCSGGNSDHEAESDRDCNDECFGTAFVDDCDNCVEGSTGDAEDWAKDVCGICYGPGYDFTGNGNDDCILNVSDVVILVNNIINVLEFDYDADMNGDGQVNVVDVVALIHTIFESAERISDAHLANVMALDNSLTLSANGYIGGVQMTLSHDNGFEIDLLDDAMIADYKTTGSVTRLVIIEPNDELLFTTNKSFDIVEMIVANSTEEIDVNMVSEFGLSTAYPNPFNPSTTVSLTVPSADYVSVKVYNLMGQMVGVLADGMMEANVYSFTWDASNMSSGVYLIKAESSSKFDVQKVLLVK